MKKLEEKNTTWIDISDPNEEDLSVLREEHKVHNLILRELPVSTIRPKVEQFEDSLYMVLHFPIYNTSQDQVEDREIDFIIKENLIVTSHLESDIEPLEELEEELKQDVNLKEKLFNEDSSQLLYHLLSKLYEFTIRELNHTERRLTETENKMFNGSQKNALKEISLLRGQIINFSRVLAPQESVLKSLREKADILFSENVHPQFTDILGDYLRAEQIVSTQSEIIESIQVTNDSLLSSKMNEVMKTLTIIGLLAVPPSIVAALIAIRFDYLPAGTGEYFWPITIIALLLDIGLIFILKKLDLL